MPRNRMIQSVLQNRTTTAHYKSGRPLHTTTADGRCDDGGCDCDPNGDGYGDGAGYGYGYGDGMF